MPELDINDFIGSILNWSGEVQVLYTEEYLNGLDNEREWIKNDVNIGILQSMDLKVIFMISNLPDTV